MSKRNSMLSPAQKKLIAEAMAMEEEEAIKAGAVGYMARALTQATIPHKNPHSAKFSRTNGHFTVYLTDLYDSGLPYGTVPRLLLAWITTEAFNTKNKKLYLGDSLSQFMGALGLIPTGGRWGTIPRLKEQMKRLFGCAISCEFDDKRQLIRESMQITKSLHVWWNPKQPDQISLFDSYLTLEQDFFDEITDRPIPIDLRAIKALKRSPMALDIYTWLTYRLSYLQAPTAISWEQLQWQLGAAYEFSEKGRKNFQQSFKKHLKSVLSVYPQAKVETIRGRLILKPSAPHISKR